MHECDYDTGKALQLLLKTPFPDHNIFRKWPEEDIKNFIKGLRVHGKNFFKIRVEFLPERDTPDLIEFYYLWKKTAGAANNSPRGDDDMEVDGGSAHVTIATQVSTGNKSVKVAYEQGNKVTLKFPSAKDKKKRMEDEALSGSSPEST